MKRVYGLTGGIASGKSTAARLLRERGAITIDADQIARDVVALGSPGLQAVVDAFGESVLHPDGTLHREALGAVVFASEAERTKLNQILHPLIAQESAVRIGEAFQLDGNPIFYEAALLVENDGYQHFAGLVVVACDRNIQIDRIMQRDELTRTQAEQRLAAQLPLADKVAAADHVVWNNGSLADLTAAVDALLETLSA